MSFSSKIKEEVLKGFTEKQKECCIVAERFGENLTQCSYKADLDEYSDFFEISNLNECCIKAILKGAFLGGGCIVDPNTDYHFEIVIKNKACADFIFNLLSVLEFTPKVLKRKKSNMYVVYIKESEQISYFLSIIEANSSMLNFEQIRVEKEVKNQVNRTTNCQTANIAKTIKSSVLQVEAIEKIKREGKFDKLSDKLKYTANLRLKYKNESLDYISNITKKSNDKNDYISKSGLKHRLDKIVEYANSL